MKKIDEIIDIIINNKQNIKYLGSTNSFRDYIYYQYVYIIKQPWYKLNKRIYITLTVNSDITSGYDDIIEINDINISSYRVKYKEILKILYSFINQYKMKEKRKKLNIRNKIIDNLFNLLNKWGCSIIMANAIYHD